MNSKHNIMMSLAVLVIFSLFIFTIFGDYGLSELKLMQKTRDSLIKKNKKLIHKNIALYRNIERLRTDIDFIENTARQELGLIGKNEIIFKLVMNDRKK